MHHRMICRNCGRFFNDPAVDAVACVEAVQLLWYFVCTDRVLSSNRCSRPWAHQSEASNNSEWLKETRCYERGLHGKGFRNVLRSAIRDLKSGRTFVAITISTHSLMETVAKILASLLCVIIFRSLPIPIHVAFSPKQFQSP